jgi:tyrosine-protein phosphatase YwqE
MYVDLHLHLLPATDDGPVDEAASLTFSARLAAGGVHEATVTPHVGHPGFPFPIASIPHRTRRLQQALDREGIALHSTRVGRSTRMRRPASASPSSI